MPTETSYVITFVPKYFLAILFYPFAPALIPAALVGAIHLIRVRSWSAAAMALCIVPLLYSARGLASSKYVAVLVLLLWIAAGTALIQRSWKLRALTILLAGFFWACSVTPFGWHFGERGAAWYFPTDHGPIPTGSYANFYRDVHQGIYQQRRMAEIVEFEELLPFLEKDTNVVVS